jgi:hypothetical protein
LMRQMAAPKSGLETTRQWGKPKTKRLRPQRELLSIQSSMTWHKPPFEISNLANLKWTTTAPGRAYTTCGVRVPFGHILKSCTLSRVAAHPTT